MNPLDVRATNCDHVLIIEDSELDRALLVKLLEAMNCRTRTATDGQSALAALETDTTDLVVLDLMLPDIDGYEVIRRMKSNPTLAQIPILVVSALSGVQDRVRALEYGADDYIVKGFDAIEFRARVRQLLALLSLKHRLEHLRNRCLLATIESPRDLRTLNLEQLKRLADEIRAELSRIVQLRSAHFASNLGVVELYIALHSVFDFSSDRIIWDTGHQIYPHKLITGRYHQIHTIRTQGGLMGYPNPAESPYDQFMTGHAGCSVSCALGLKTADDLLGRTDRRSVAVIGDGALPSGIVFEALNNAGELGKDLLVVLNDNKMSICPPIGGLARYLDRGCLSDGREKLKRQVEQLLGQLTRKGDGTKQPDVQVRAALEASISGGTLFEDFGWRYVGPVDGHDLGALIPCLERLKKEHGPVLLHVLTEKGHGFAPAAKDPVKYHAPAQFAWNGKEVVPLSKGSAPAYTNVASDAIYGAMKRDPRVAVITAAMCEGNKLQKVRAEIPARFFDTGICESHAVAFAAGLAKSGMRPVVAIYSTFLQRGFDQLFQEVALQNLPVTLCLDRAGLTGPDGPTHHGAFDLAYLRSLPNFVIMAPGDELDLPLMLDFALEHSGPAALRYPKANVERVARDAAPLKLGLAEVIGWGLDGMLIACGTQLNACVKAADRLRSSGLDVGVINARFVKPIDRDTILLAIEQCGFVLTVEEGTLNGGFGSAVLEAANEAALDTHHVRRLGLPDRFVEHAEREELLHDLRLDEEGIYTEALELATRLGLGSRPKVQNGEWELLGGTRLACGFDEPTSPPVQPRFPWRGSMPQTRRPLVWAGVRLEVPQ